LKSIIKKGRVVAAFLLALVLAVTALPMFSMPAFADTANLSFNPASQSVDKLESFTVAVMINVDEATRSAELSLSWDPALLRLDDADEGTFYSTWASANGGFTFFMAGTINNTAGTLEAAAISILGGAAGGPSGSGTLMTFDFTALSTDGISSLELDGVTVGDASSQPFATIVLDEGSVTVGVPPIPDLIVSTKTETETGAGTGMYIVNYEICNVGYGPAAASTTCIYVNGLLVNQQPCSALAIGACEAKSSIAIPLVSGDVLKVCADNENVVAETNEGNNCKTNTFSNIYDVDETVITGTITGVIEIIAPDDILDATLQIGDDNCASDTLNVRSNGKYQVLVSDEDPTTGGRMTQWNGATYLSKKLINPVDIGGTACPCSVIGALPGPVLLVTNQACTDASGRDHDVCFHQTVEWADPTLPAGHVYRIVVTFTAVQTGPCD
jgi:hypothetical protein